MSGFWKGVLWVVASVVVVAVGVGAWLQWRVSQETVTPLATANPGGETGKALLVYHPGLSSFPQEVTTAFAEGLVASGWVVSTTTASAEAPADVADYDLIILGSPVYSSAAAKPLTRYVERVKDFGGKPVVILLTAAGNVEGATTATEALVKAANGRPIETLGLMTWRPNDEADKYTGSNTERAIKMARAAGQALRLPAP